MQTPSATPVSPLGWLGIVRLGLVQTALGAIVVLTTSTLNRVMVVELALPAILPGALVGFHYAIQVLRPRWGYGSDQGGRHVPWIIGGMGVLGLGGLLAAISVALMTASFSAGLALAIFAFLLIGIGVGAAGTTLLVLLAKRVAPERRAAAATIVWVMMIFGFIVTTIIAGHFLDPYSPARLVAVTATVSALAFALACLAIFGMEAPRGAAETSAPGCGRITSSEGTPPPNFRAALADVWSEPDARRFTIFVFVSMLAYSAQDLILEPFAGTVFGMTPGESTQLAGLQHSGVLAGMIAVAAIATFVGGKWFGSLKTWTIAGCIASACALFGLSIGGLLAPHWPIQLSVVLLGIANGGFAVAAIGSMMALASSGKSRREGTRMGLWGAAQAIAFGCGGFIGALGVDIVRAATGTPLAAYVTVFALEGVLFIVAAVLALQIGRERASRESLSKGPSVLVMGQSMLPATESKS